MLSKPLDFEGGSDGLFVDLVEEEGLSRNPKLEAPHSPPSLAPQGSPLPGWHQLFDATAANRKALWNQARRHLHPFPFPFPGLLGTDFFESGP